MFFKKYVDKLVTYNLPSQKVWRLSSEDKFLKLDWNETTIKPSPKVKEAVLDFVDNGFMNWYPDINNNS